MLKMSNVNKTEKEVLMSFEWIKPLKTLFLKNLIIDKKNVGIS